MITCMMYETIFRGTENSQGIAILGFYGTMRDPRFRSTFEFRTLLTIIVSANVDNAPRCDSVTGQLVLHARFSPE